MNTAVLTTMLSNNRKRRAAAAAEANKRAVKIAALELLSTAKIEAKIEVTEELIESLKECMKNNEKFTLNVSDFEITEQ